VINIAIAFLAPAGGCAFSSYHRRSEGGIAFSRVRLCVCLSVCLSVNTITPEPFEISSRNFQDIILYGQKGEQVGKWLFYRCARVVV